jgi:hypothetical protein
MFAIYVVLWVIGFWLIHSVLSRCAKAIGWRSARAEYFITGISLFWPVAPELAFPLMVVYAVWQAAKWLSEEEAKQAAANQPTAGVSQ